MTSTVITDAFHMDNSVDKILQRSAVVCCIRVVIRVAPKEDLRGTGADYFGSAVIYK